MVANWQADGTARAALVDGAPKAGLSSIVIGLGSLSYGELAGERMKLGLMLHDPEEEHDCFSDNTHNSHYYDALGIANVYLGRYQRVDGSTVEGASLSDLVARPTRRSTPRCAPGWRRPSRRCRRSRTRPTAVRWPTIR